LLKLIYSKPNNPFLSNLFLSYTISSNSLNFLLEMMKESWMEVLPPVRPHFPSSQSWFQTQRRSIAWTPEENKAFEDALARYDRDTPDRWEKVAKLINKSVVDVMTHYRDLEDDVSSIEAGLWPFPQYHNSSSGGFTLDWESSHGFKSGYCVGGKRGGSRGAEQERKKGVPWTEDEHRSVLNYCFST
jgi:Myb-like DNA-binding domain